MAQEDDKRSLDSKEVKDQQAIAANEKMEALTLEKNIVWYDKVELLDEAGKFEDDPKPKDRKPEERDNKRDRLIGLFNFEISRTFAAAPWPYN